MIYNSSHLKIAKRLYQSKNLCININFQLFFLIWSITSCGHLFMTLSSFVLQLYLKYDLLNYFLHKMICLRLAYQYCKNDFYMFTRNHFLFLCVCMV